MTYLYIGAAKYSEMRTPAVLIGQMQAADYFKIDMQISVNDD